MLWLCSAMVMVSPFQGSGVARYAVKRCCIPRERGHSVSDPFDPFVTVHTGSYSVRGDLIRRLLRAMRKEHDDTVILQNQNFLATLT